MRVIVDTDAGPDDLMALAFLLAQPGLTIEAVTISYGLAHPGFGAQHVARLLRLADRPEIPVFLGSAQPLPGGHAFPQDWRRVSSELPGVELPGAFRAPEAQSAASFLAQRLSQRAAPVRLLTLGSLTNVAEALAQAPACAAGIEELVVMGGAFEVPGIVFDVDVFRSPSAEIEWNLFLDPRAARAVLESGAAALVVPLDATRQVPIDTAFVCAVRALLPAPLGRFVSQILGSLAPYIEPGPYFAWDPLAAVALVDAGVLRTRSAFVSVETEPPHPGRTRFAAQGRAPLRIAVDADGERFAKSFLGALEVRAGLPRA